jgi:hypothetical protein
MDQMDIARLVSDLKSTAALLVARAQAGAAHPTARPSRTLT